MTKTLQKLFSSLIILALALVLMPITPAFADPADDLVITGIIDGPLTGGIPKAVELYAVNAIPDLSIYGIGLANNGGGSDGIEFTFPADSVPAGSCIYVATDAVSFNAFFGFDPSYIDGDATANNGDDAFELFTNSVVSDVFGDINVDGTGEPWDHLDGWAYRNSGTGPDGSTFVLGNWSFSGTNALDGETSNATAAIPFPLGTYSPCTVFTPPPPPTDWIINEINADPDSTAGDANGDGVAHFSDDEFVEIVNNSGTDADISGWTISDGFGVRHTFPSGTVVPDSCSVVVFGGGTPTGTFGNSLVQTASSGSVGLNNGGDTVTLNDGVTNQANHTYGSDGGDNQSLTRDPDVTGADPLVKHSLATGSGGALFSPGTLVDGSQFTGCPVNKKIHEVQGNGSTSPLVGVTVIVEGIVVGDFQDDVGVSGDLNGFFVQEEDDDADGDSATSEGVFVFQGSNPTVDVAVGDHVRVEGSVSEYFGDTQITSFSGVTVNSSGNPLPAASVLSLPVTAISDFEAYEGMYVTFPQALVISEYYNFDRFGEIVLTTDRQFQPTAVFEPGSGDAANLADLNARSRITLDDGRTASNPDPAIHPNGLEFDLTNLFRGGDTVEDVTGVINYAFGLYRVQPTQGANYTSVNSRTASPDPVGGNVTVASFNVLNYFTSLDTIQEGSNDPNDPADDICGPLADQECRGADTAEELTRQRDKIIAAIAAIDADVVGLIEIENHPGDVPTADLVSGLNDVMGKGTYDYIATGAVGIDAIRVAFIYKPTTVTPVGGYAALDDQSFTNPLGYVDEDGNLEEKSRPALAQTFLDNNTGGFFTTVVNHLKSKGSSCGPGDDDPEAGSCNLTRTLGAQALIDWLATDPTGSGDEDFLIIGDLNSYDKEDPIDTLIAGGYSDQVYQNLGENAYSYVFDGQLGYLDHALANADLTNEVTDVTIWHINADEPDAIDYDTSFKKDAQDAIYAPDAYRSSDHDPVIIGLDLNAEQFNELFDAIQFLVDDGTLNDGQGNALTSKLENVLAKLAKGNTNAAVNQLGAFINQVEDYIDEGILTTEQGNQLIDAATFLVELLS